MIIAVRLATLLERKVWFGLVWSATVCFLLQEGKLNRDLLFKADSERLQTSMPGAGFESADLDSVRTIS